MRFLFSTLCLIMTLGMLTGCSGTPEDGEQLGHVAFALTGNNGYRLSGDITLDPQGTGDDIVLTATLDDAFLVAAIPEGTYDPSLSSWNLLNGSDESVVGDVKSFAFSPDPIVIAADATTNVTITFQVGDESVELTFGAVAFSVVIEEADCLPECGVDESCITQNGGAPSCVADCVDSGDCGGGESCYEGSCVTIPVAP